MIILLKYLSWYFILTKPIFVILAALTENFNRNIMRLAKNESRFVGTTFEALAELSPERSERGLMTPFIFAEAERIKVTIGALKFFSRIIQ
jgi:hypothetical protein